MQNRTATCQLCALSRCSSRLCMAWPAKLCSAPHSCDALLGFACALMCLAVLCCAAKLNNVSMVQVIGKRIKMQGFIVMDYYATLGEQFQKDMTQVSLFCSSCTYRPSLSCVHACLFGRESSHEHDSCMTPWQSSSVKGLQLWQDSDLLWPVIGCRHMKCQQLQ